MWRSHLLNLNSHSIVKVQLIMKDLALVLTPIHIYASVLILVDKIELYDCPALNVFESICLNAETPVSNA